MKHLRNALVILLAAVFWASFVALSGLVVENSIPYFTDYEADPFVLEKGAVGQATWYQWMLLVHVVAGIVCLFLVILQFFRGVLRRFPWLHRWLGRAYAWSILTVLVPSGMVLAFHAKGGLPGSIGFMLNGTLAFAFTLQGIVLMWRKDVTGHVRSMIRSFAMISAALTFRIFHILLFLAEMDPDLNYVVSLWASTLGNLLMAELVIFLAWRTKRGGRGELSPTKPKPQTIHEHQIHEPDPVVHRDALGGNQPVRRHHST